MKKALLLVLVTAGVASAAPAPADPTTLVSCRSIDVTFRPFYHVRVRPAGITGALLVDVEKTIDLPGSVVERQTFPAAGEVGKDAFSITFSGSGVSARMRGERLENGLLKGALHWNGEPEHELLCNNPT